MSDTLERDGGELLDVYGAMERKRIEMEHSGAAPKMLRSVPAEVAGRDGIPSFFNWPAMLLGW